MNSFAFSISTHTPNTNNPDNAIQYQRDYVMHICDMIKRNESDVGNIDFKILAKTVFKFLRFKLFLVLTNSSYLCNQLSNCNGISIKIKHFEVMRKCCKKIELIFSTSDSFSLIMSHIVTGSRYGCHA